MVSCSTRPARAGSPVSVELRVLTLTEALSSVLSLQAKFSLSLWRNTRFLMHMCTVARDKGSWLSSKERLNVRSGTKAAQEKQLVPTPPSFYGRSIAKPWKSSARRNCQRETTPSTTGKNESWRRRRERVKEGRREKELRGRGMGLLCVCRVMTWAPYAVWIW